jgi:uncharacterized membrane protein YwzB
MVFVKVKQKGNRVIVKFNGAPKSDIECLEGYVHLLEQVYAKQEKFLILYDARDIAWMSFHHIKMQAEFMKEKEPQTRLYMVRAAIVVNSFAARTILNTLFSIRKPAAPCQIFTDLEEAKEYLRGSQLPINMSEIVASISEQVEYAKLTVEQEQVNMIKLENIYRNTLKS